MIKKKIIGILCVLCIAGLTLWGFKRLLVLQDARNEKYTWRVWMHDKIDIKNTVYEQRSKFFILNYNIKSQSKDNEEGNAFYSTNGGIYRAGKYYIAPYYKYKSLQQNNKPVDGRNTIEMEYFYLDYYELVDGKLQKIKTVDCNQIVKEYDNKLNADSCLKVFLKDDKPVALIETYKASTDESSYWENALSIDLESEKIITKEFSQHDDVLRKQDDMNIFNATNLYSKLKMIGVSPVYKERRSFIVNTEYWDSENKEDTPRKSDWKEIGLLGQHPDLEHFFEVLKDTNETVIFFDNENTVEEIANYLLPKNESLFSNLMIEKNSSIDGQEHSIASLDEFRQWYKYSPQNYEQTLLDEKSD